MQDATHVHAVFARAFPILGVRLLPLRLGHWRLLEALESPFVFQLRKGAVESASGRDLVLAVAVCSRSYRAARRLLLSPARLAVLSWWWGVRHAKRDMLEEARYFREYFAAWTAYPTRHAGENERSSAMPTAVRLAWLISTRMPVAAAWEFPAIEAMEFCAVEDERKGGRFLTASERLDIERRAALEARIASGWLPPGVAEWRAKHAAIRN